MAADDKKKRKQVYKFKLEGYMVIDASSIDDMTRCAKLLGEAEGILKGAGATLAKKATVMSMDLPE